MKEFIKKAESKIEELTSKSNHLLIQINNLKAKKETSEQIVKNLENLALSENREIKQTETKKSVLDSFTKLGFSLAIISGAIVQFFAPTVALVLLGVFGTASIGLGVSTLTQAIKQHKLEKQHQRTLIGILNNQFSDNEELLKLEKEKEEVDNLLKEVKKEYETFKRSEKASKSQKITTKINDEVLVK